MVLLITAVDIWAAGVIFLSLLAGRIHIFNPADDMESLSQMAVIFGSKRMQDVAKQLGKREDEFCSFVLFFGVCDA